MGASSSLFSRVLLVAIPLIGCFPASAYSQDAEKTKPKAETGSKRATIKPLTKEQQNDLLKKRLNGGMGDSFRLFSNRFLVTSRVDLSYGVGLMTPSQEIADTELRPVFPGFHKPTLEEYLDAIALQTKSRSKYDRTSKYFQSEVETGPVEDLAIFEFTKTDRKKPFQVTLPKRWRSIDKGNWMMFAPPIFPLGMDIHELTTSVILQSVRSTLSSRNEPSLMSSQCWRPSQSRSQNNLAVAEAPGGWMTNEEGTLL